MVEPVPSGNGLLYGAVAFLVALFGIIGAFIFKLHNDEKQAKERAQVAREMLEGEDRGPRRQQQPQQQRRHVFNESDEEEPDSEDNGGMSAFYF